MTHERLAERFEAMGARVRVRPLVQRVQRWRVGGQVMTPTGWPRLDVRTDRHGEYFDVALPDGTTLDVLDLDRTDRHALVLARTSDGDKAKFLLGHDERHWFVAAVPDNVRGVRDVITAKRALQPEPVREELHRQHVPEARGLRRRNAVYVRQGEWFFVPAAIGPDPAAVLRNEPLRRDARSKPHVCDEVYRRGGVLVHVHGRHARTGIEPDKWRALPDDVRTAFGWSTSIRDPEVFAKGRVRHADHATVELRGWHRVYMNTEAAARAAEAIAFLD